MDDEVPDILFELEERCNECNGTGTHHPKAHQSLQCKVCDGLGLHPTLLGEAIIALVKKYSH